MITQNIMEEIMKNQLNELEKIIMRIEHGNKILCQSIKPEIDYIILIGPTGAGKTTLANVLTGHKIIWDSFTGVKSTFVVEGPSPLEICHDNKSGTGIPNVYKEYIDCPGFGDTDPQKELENATFIESVFKLTRRHKILIVAESSSILGGKAKEFVKLLADIDKGMGNKFGEFSKHFGLCISKVSSDDFESEILDDVHILSEQLQGEITASERPEKATMIKMLEDRIICFMKRDTNDLIQEKLQVLLEKMDFAEKVPICPVISTDGRESIDKIIINVFEVIINLYTDKINEYVTKTKFDLCIQNIKDFPTLQKKLEEHSKRFAILKQWHNTISDQKDINELVDNLCNFSQEVKALNIHLSTLGLGAVKYVAPLYPESNKLVEGCALKIASLFELGNLAKIKDLLSDLNIMDSEWEVLKHLTTPDNTTKALIIAGTSVGGVSLAVMSGGMALPGLVGVGLAGASVSSLAVVKFGICDAYKKDHPQVVPHDNKFRNSCKKMPGELLELWFNAHNSEKSEYLPELQNELIGAVEANDTVYNDIFV